MTDDELRERWIGKLVHYPKTNEIGTVTDIEPRGGRAVVEIHLADGGYVRLWMSAVDMLSPSMIQKVYRDRAKAWADRKELKAKLSGVVRAVGEFNR